MNTTALTPLGFGTVVFIALTVAPALSQTAPRQAAWEKPSGNALTQTTRFDDLVRADFFAGIARNQARFDGAMKFLEETLVQNPRHAEALAWHGGRLVA